MKRTGKLTAITVALAAALTIMAPLTSASAGTKAEAADMLALHNQARQDDGEKALSQARRIARYAKHHSKEMAQAGYLYHTDSLANVMGKRHWSIAGENVGVSDSLDNVMQGFMASPEHRSNILRSGYEHAGVGVYRQELETPNGTVVLYWVTVVFYG